MCKCAICYREFEEYDTDKIRLYENNGFCSSSFNIDVCDKCQNNIFVNSYGFEFIMYDKQLYIKNPINGCFEMACSKKDVDAAFDPERARFNRWLEKQ